MSDLISRQDAIGIFTQLWDRIGTIMDRDEWEDVCRTTANELPSAQSERLTDDDFETIRIHLSAYKEGLCNQHRWKEAEEYQRIIDRFMSFTSEHLPKGEWLRMSDFSEKDDNRYKCSRCGNVVHHKSRMDLYTFNSWCGRCGSDNSRHTDKKENR